MYIMYLFNIRLTDLFYLYSRKIELESALRKIDGGEWGRGVYD